FCGTKGIRRDYSNARTPQQNGVAERKNQTLIEAARTMLVDSLLPIVFWSEAVATACYVLNRVLVTKPHHKTPYELLTGDKPSISYLKPFGCHVTILNTSDPLGKFDKKSDEGYIVGYSISSKAYRPPGPRLLWGSSGEGSGDVMEVVEWPGMEERWGKNPSELFIASWSSFVVGIDGRGRGGVVEWLESRGEGGKSVGGKLGCEVNSGRYFERGRDDTVGTLGC
nr:ribonuclease H-like domain-containing protein [Tanacetum cinerariifolium]